MRYSFPDGSLYYEIQGAGTPVVFLHGDGLDTRMWDAQFDYFAQYFQVLRYDLRGYGQSSLPAEQKFSHYADLKSLLTYLQLSQVHLIGLSLGGHVALDFTLEHPEKVKSLVLVDSGLSGFPFSPEFLATLKEIAHVAIKKGLPEARKQWLGLEVFRYSLHNPATKRQLEDMILNTPGYRWYGHNQSQPLRPKTIERLSELEVPTYVLTGEHDTADFQAIADILHQTINSSQKEILPNAGHMVNMDNPELFNAKVLNFLSTI